jgi:hypothetical protein
MPTSGWCGAAALGRHGPDNIDHHDVIARPRYAAGDAFSQEGRDDYSSR